MRVILLAAVGISVSMSTAGLAQAPPAPPLPPVEIGVGVDATWMRRGLFLDTNVVTEPMVHFRATVPMTRNLAIEAIFAVTKQVNTTSFDDRTAALYAIQVKQTAWRRARTQVFATYGAAGKWTRGPFRYTSPPFYLVAGGGFQWEFARRAALRVEMQGVLFAGLAPIGTRLSTGMSFRLGRYR